jgi:hypothetical protein
MTYSDALNLVLDAAVERWAQNTNQHALGRAINIVDERQRRDALDRNMIVAWMAPREGGTQ